MIVLILLLFSALFYLPILLNPNILVARGNDLTEFFFPIFYYVRDSLIRYHQLPFWNNLFFSGTPLLPDPQSPIFYLPNIIFIFFRNIDTGFLISIFIHIFLSGIGMYLLSRKGFGFSRNSSLFCSLLYVSSVKLSGYIEAGHFGLIASWAWIPFTFLMIILLSKKPTFKKSVLLSVTLAGIFYTHVLIFVITVISSTILFTYLTLVKRRDYFHNFFYLFLSGIFCFGFIAVAFLPQISWQADTTRNLLLNSPDVYPKWLTKTEFVKAFISPILFGPKFIWDLDTEKTIAVGFFAGLFSIFGFLRLKINKRILLGTIIFILFLLSLNNLSPIYNLLIKQNWYILLRVSTRFWFLIVLIFIYLAGLGFEKLIKIKKIRFLVYTIALLAIIETLLTSWTKILKPIPINSTLVPNAVYEYLSQDKSLFRVFCLERCLSQKESAIYGLQLAEGYGTLQQMNYYDYSQQLSQAFYRNRYTLSIPPFEIFEYESLQPYSPNLTAFNIKYVISDHVLKDKNLQVVKRVGKYLIYENKINLPRANYPISFYSPNFITVDTSNFKDDSVILSEIYSRDWSAYLNGSKNAKIIETPDKTREVKIGKNTKFVNFIYLPKSFLVGLGITVVALIVALIVFLL